MWYQKVISLKPQPRGFHLITNQLVAQLPELNNYSVGLAHFFIQHTSAALTINENADPTVRIDMQSHFDHLVPENQSYYLHTHEGPDDMPAHLKTSLIGNSLSIPIQQGVLALGTWQGIYLAEHRQQATSRYIVVTLNGQFSET